MRVTQSVPMSSVASTAVAPPDNRNLNSNKLTSLAKSIFETATALADFLNL